MRWRLLRRYLRACPECGFSPTAQNVTTQMRWDHDPIVIRFGYLAGRCGRCGERLSHDVKGGGVGPGG